MVRSSVSRNSLRLCVIGGAFGLASVLMDVDHLFQGYERASHVPLATSLWLLTIGLISCGSGLPKRSLKSVTWYLLKPSVLLLIFSIAYIPVHEAIHVIIDEKFGVDVVETVYLGLFDKQLLGVTLPTLGGYVMRQYTRDSQVLFWHDQLDVSGFMVDFGLPLICIVSICIRLLYLRSRPRDRLSLYRD